MPSFLLLYPSVAPSANQRPWQSPIHHKSLLSLSPAQPSRPFPFASCSSFLHLPPVSVDRTRVSHLQPENASDLCPTDLSSRIVCPALRVHVYVGECEYQECLSFAVSNQDMTQTCPTCNSGLEGEKKHQSDILSRIPFADLAVALPRPWSGPKLPMRNSGVFKMPLYLRGFYSGVLANRGSPDCLLRILRLILYCKKKAVQPSAPA
ncbi:hypothetical protein GGI42DRAFT_64942 [Trichoderma sp. SZMC 28013]